MPVDPEAYDPALERALAHTRVWLSSLATRPVGPQVTADDLAEGFGGPLPSDPSDPAEVVDLLARLAEPGLMAMPAGTFFGWVIGGTLPAALAADWLVSAWDQNAGMRLATPGVVAAEEAAAGWLLDLLGLPTGAAVGFVTGATMSNFGCLAAARQQVLGDVGWDVDRLGLTGAPRVRVLVGDERHATVDLALRYLGLGAPTVVAADDEGRLRLDALERELAAGPGPLIVCLQAGNIHSGAFDPMGPAIDLVHRHGGWVHVDGAFGLWAAASDRLRLLIAGYERADSWTTDAHKTLNVPYDCGLAIVARPAPLRAAMGAHASYLLQDEDGSPDPLELVPELSRRARGVPVWAALRSLGRTGVAALVEGLVDAARQLADGIRVIEGAEVLNCVDYTQVCVAFEDDARTRAVTERVLSGGATWMSGSRWRGREVLRISVSNWSTDRRDVAASVAAIARACVEARPAGPKQLTPAPSIASG